MNLTLDIGNTLVKSAFFENRELISHESFPFEREKINRLIRQHSGRIIISSVVENDFTIEAGKVPDILFLTEQTQVPLKNNYQTPDTLGKDRLANAVAIHRFSPSKNALAIDCGTCLKFDLVFEGAYSGGSISPGLHMRFNALHTFTDKLPLIQPEQYHHLNGMNTKESILSGCYRGMLAEINQTISDYETNFGKMEIYLTGGDHLFFADHLKNRIFADPFLTLKGLNEILLFQNT